MQNAFKNITFLKLDRILKPMNTMKSTAHLSSSLNKTLLDFKENETSFDNNKYSSKSNNRLHSNSEIQVTHPFDKEIRLRMDQAQRTFLVKLSGTTEYEKSNTTSFFRDLNMMGIQVQSAHLFSWQQILVELKQKEHVDQLKLICEISDKKFPITTRIITYKRSSKYFHQNFRYNIIDHTKVNLVDYDYESFEKVTDISKQIKIFYESNRIDDFNLRLRYFLSSLVEDCMKGLLRDSTCIPFGSSTNTFGTKSADLDLNFSLAGHRKLIKTTTNKYLMNNSEFFFKIPNKYIRKPNSSKDESIKNIFALFETLFKSILPNFKFESAIPHAKVPILKFKIDIGHLYSCDLSMTETETAYLMTKLFWTFSKLDERVAPTVFFIRHWAAKTGVKSISSPSTLFSSFHLSCLVFYYFLNLEQPLIVPVNDLIKNYDPVMNVLNLENYESKVSEMQEILGGLQFENNFLKFYNLKNKMEIIDLVQGFFQFYSNFDFSKNEITLNRKKNSNLIMNKNGKCYIQHPFNPLANACKNLSATNLNIFKIKCQKTYNVIQKSKENLNLKDLISQFKEISNVEMSIFDDMNYDTR